MKFTLLRYNLPPIQLDAEDICNVTVENSVLIVTTIKECTYVGYLLQRIRI